MFVLDRSSRKTTSTNQDQRQPNTFTEHRIENIQKVLIHKKGYSYLVEGANHQLSHYYLFDSGLNAPLPDFIEKNREGEGLLFVVINVRAINDSEIGKMWGTIRCFNKNWFEVDLHVHATGIQ